MISDNNDSGFGPDKCLHDHHHGFDKPWGRSTHGRRGDVRPIILSLLLVRPMHGYELIRSIEEKSHGMWRPSPGTIYPLLQLLEETDIVVAREEEGKKIYSLTDIGIEEAKQKPSEDRWKGYDKKDIEKIVELKKNNIKAMHLIRNIARSGDKEKLSAATKIIKDTSDRLMALTDEPTKDLNDKRGKS